MEKENINTGLYFVPDRPGSIFVGIDRYHHYSSTLPSNILTFVQNGNVDDRFRSFLIDNIKEAECCPYIPDVELLRYDLDTMREVPPVNPYVSFGEYVRRELLPYFEAHCLPPVKRISLHDAVYTYRHTGEPDGGILKRYLMQESAYMDFRLRQQERKTLYRCHPRYELPLKVVENDFGFLVFSANEIGKAGFKECIQHIADRYFDPHHDIDHLAVYDCTSPDKSLIPLIDSCYGPCKPSGLDNRFDFSLSSYVKASRLPDGLIDKLHPAYYHSMEPTADAFLKFASDWHLGKDIRTTVSRANHDICRLLTVMKTGYMNIHEQPFTYSSELLPYAERLERVTQIRTAKDFDTEKFRQASDEIRKAAALILRRDLDVRGHRSLKNMLADPTVRFTIGSRQLNEAQKSVLSSGYALYIPENNTCVTRHLQYCRADFEQNRFVNSSRPFGIKAYMMKDGTLCPLPEEKKEVPKAENRNKRNNNRIK